MLTRSKTGKSKPKVLMVHSEPTSTKKALTDPQWFLAMKAEYDSLIQNDTWELTSLPSDRKHIHCKWVFKVKENTDGSINKLKARLVAKGFHQHHGFNFHETFSLVVKPITIRIILTLAISCKWKRQYVNVNNAFSNGVLKEEVYM